MLFQSNTCTPVFIAALSTIAKVWKEPKFPLMDEWIKKMWYIHIYTHTHMYTHICIYVYTCVYTCLYVYTYVFIYVYIYTHNGVLLDNQKE